MGLAPTAPLRGVYQRTSPLRLAIPKTPERVFAAVSDDGFKFFEIQVIMHSDARSMCFVAVGT